MTEMTTPASCATTPHWRIDAGRAAALARLPIAAGFIEIVDETGSTNTDLMQRMKALPREHAASGVQAVRVAYLQTAGRGRQGRQWHTSPGHALTFSLACVLPRPLSGLAGLSLAVGVALVERLRALAADAHRITLKWPNDVLLDGGKLAGILVETAWSTPQATAAVIGIGLNLYRDEALIAALADSAAAVPAAVRATPPAALSGLVSPVEPSETLAAVLTGLADMLERFGADGFAPFCEPWCNYHAYAGREVVLLEQGGELARGTALGVDTRGQLQLSTPQGLRTVATGDVSLRLAPAAT